MRAATDGAPVMLDRRGGADAIPRTWCRPAKETVLGTTAVSRSRLNLVNEVHTTTQPTAQTFTGCDRRRELFNSLPDNEAHYYRGVAVLNEWADPRVIVSYLGAGPEGREGEERAESAHPWMDPNERTKVGRYPINQMLFITQNDTHPKVTQLNALGA
jgi:hypothetical protein